MPSTILNRPEPIDPTVLGFSHTVSTPVGGALVFIAGQCGCDHTGQTTSPGFTTQVERSFAILLIAVHAVGLGAGDVVHIRSYIVDHEPDKLEILVGALRRVWGDRRPAETLVGVAALALPGMLFEVEAVAARAVT